MKSLCVMITFWILSVILLPTVLRAGGAWTLEKGELNTGLNFSSLFYYKVFNRTNPKIDLNREVYDITVVGNMEYGLTPKLTIALEIPYKIVGTYNKLRDERDFEQTLPSAQMPAFGNLKIGGRYQLLKRESVLAMQFFVEANTSDLNFYEGLQTGTNSWGYYPTLSFGHSFDHTYISLDMGLGIRSNNYSESFLGLFEGGGRPGNGKWWLIGVMQVEKAFYNGDYNDLTTAQTGLHVNNQEHISYGIKTILPFGEQISFTAGLYGSVYGNGVGSFPSVNIGLNWKGMVTGPKSAKPNRADI